MLLTKHANLPRIIILVLLLASTATGYAQEGKISVKSKKVSVGELIRSIESQTSYLFSYNKNNVDEARTLDLPGGSMELKDLLDAMIEGVNINYMVHGRYIAFVPSEDYSRPQVRQPVVQRTSDVYVRNDPDAMSASSMVKPAAQPAVAEPRKETAAVPEPRDEWTSDHRPIDIYGGVQKSLPRFAVKVDLLYGLATFTPNISAEVALSRRSTLALTYSNNPWKHDADLNDNKKFLHGTVGLEYRYWLCERYSGHFFGAHALYSEYNISGYTVPMLFKKDYRYKGNAYGGGLLYGYALPIGRMWNIEFEAGFDILRMDYDRYGCRTCDTNREPFKKTNFVPSAGVNIVFLIK